MASANLLKIFGGAGGAGVSLVGVSHIGFGTGTTSSGIGSGTVASVNISAGVTTCLTFTGRYLVNSLLASSIDPTAGSLRVIVEVDGSIVADSTELGSTRVSTAIINQSAPQIICNTSFVLKMSKPLSTAVVISYIAVPIA